MMKYTQYLNFVPFGLYRVSIKTQSGKLIMKQILVIVKKYNLYSVKFYILDSSSVLWIPFAFKRFFIVAMIPG